MRISLSALLLTFLIITSGAAYAAPIEYLFEGTGTGTLGSKSFSGAFTITMIGNTTSVIHSSPNYFTNVTTDFFTSGSLTGVFKGGTSIVLNTESTFPNIGFAQSVPAPVYGVDEATVNTAFEPYNLMTSFPLTSGTVSFLDQTFLTGQGNLSFTGISALAFEAQTLSPAPSAVPLPPALPLFAAALLGIGLLAHRRRRSA